MRSFAALIVIALTVSEIVAGGGGGGDKKNCKGVQSDPNDQAVLEAFQTCFESKVSNGADKAEAMTSCQASASSGSKGCAGRSQMFQKVMKNIMGKFNDIKQQIANGSDPKEIFSGIFQTGKNMLKEMMQKFKN